MQPPNIQPNFDVTVRVGCSLVYEATGTASLLLNLKIRPDRNSAVLFEAMTLGNNLPLGELCELGRIAQDYRQRQELLYSCACFLSPW